MHNRLLLQLFEHMRWADGRLLDALRASPPPAEALELYAHVVGAEHVWLRRIEGRAADVAVWPVLTIEELAALAEANATAFVDLARGCTEEDLQRPVRYRNSAGLEFTTRADDILLHVGMHGQYHRGQVNQLLRKAGLAPAPVDYIAFVRGVAAATRNDARA